MITLSTNLKTKANTQFNNFDFNSFATLGNKVFCASSAGLFMLGGDLDNASQIDASFTIAETDFGIPNNKRLRYLYFSLYATDDITGTLVADRSVEQAFTFSIPYKNDSVRRIRIPISKVIKGSRWTLTLGNTKGCKFSVFEITGQLVVLNLGRR